MSRLILIAILCVFQSASMVFLDNVEGLNDDFSLQGAGLLQATTQTQESEVENQLENALLDLSSKIKKDRLQLNKRTNWMTKVVNVIKRYQQKIVVVKNQVNALNDDLGTLTGKKKKVQNLMLEENLKHEIVETKNSDQKLLQQHKSTIVDLEKKLAALQYRSTQQL